MIKFKGITMQKRVVPSNMENRDIFGTVLCYFASKFNVTEK